MAGGDPAPLGAPALARALAEYREQAARYPPWLVARIRRACGGTRRQAPPPGEPDGALAQAVARYQRAHGLRVDGVAAAVTAAHLFGADLRARVGPLPASLDPGAIHSGRPRGRSGLFQRRVRPRVFGEPAFECELVAAAVAPQRPHVVAYDAWRKMVAAAIARGLDPGPLAIHSAYRSVALQREVFAYRLEERRRVWREAGEPELEERELRRQQRRWTAAPGTSAHHTGFALDLALYAAGRGGAKRAPAYPWLATHAARFGFYPYLPEGWHWEYNPPGLVAQVAELRRRIPAGEPFEALLRAPDPIPVAAPAVRART